MPRFRYLMAEQAAPDQLIAFLLVAIVAALALAFLFYALVLAGLWRWRLREVTTLGALLFPSWSRLRENAGEYALAVATSLLLTLTIWARHDVVAQVNSLPLSQIPYASVLQVLPLGALQADDLHAGDAGADSRAAALASLTHETRPARSVLDSVTASAVLKPVLEAGGSDRAELLAKLILEEVRSGSRWQWLLDERVLIGLALLLLVAYASWLAWDLNRSVATRRAAALTEYRQLWQRLLVPAACLALLLVSAVGAGDAQRLARSAVAAAAVIDLDDSGSDAAGRLRSAIEGQRARAQQVSYLLETEEGDSIPGVLASLALLHRRNAAADSARDRLQQAITDVEAALLPIAEELSRVRGRFETDSAAAASDRAALGDGIRDARAELTRAGRVLDSLALGLRRAQNQLALMDSLARVQAALQRRNEALERSIAGLEEELQRLARSRQGAVLFVAMRREAGYDIRPVGQQRRPVQSGEWLGVHELPPGLYWVTSPIGTDSITLAPGAFRSIVVPRTLPPIGAADAAPPGTARLRP